MSISNSLRKAAVIQEKIEGLRKQLIELLSRARAEITAEPETDVPAAGRAPAGKRRGRKPAAAAAAAPAASEPAAKPAKPSKPTRRRRAKGSSLSGRKRVASPSGPLAPAVVRVLQASRKPMNVRDILDGLASSGFEYRAPDPKKNLAARIYRLGGVKQVGPGLFAAE